jgi:UDP-N-acetylmuramoylalanine-D-glutamate ligase
MEETKPVAAAEMPKPKKAGGFKKFIRWFTFILILGLGLFVYWKYYYTYSDGYRSGLLQKFSHRGNVMKTYEGELVLSSVASTNNVALASEKFFFSVANDSIAKVLQNFEGKRVRLHYTQKNGALPWRGDSEYIVDGVQAETNP